MDTASMTSREIDRAVGASVHSGSSIYALNLEALAAAKPDLILTQELCEVCAVSYREVSAAARMMEVGPTVVSLEPRTLEGILSNIETVGGLTGTTERATTVVDEAQARLDRILESVRGNLATATVCIEWIDPLYDAGHWVPDQVEHAGGVEMLGRPGQPSRRIEWDDVLAAQPQVLVLLPCGLDLERAHREAASLVSRPGWSGLPAVRKEHVWVVNGPAYFNRPGPRVIRGVEVLAHLLHGIGTVTPSEAVRLTGEEFPTDRWRNLH